MKYLFILITLFVLTSCDVPVQQPEEDINTKYEKEFNALQSPVILIGKDTTGAFNSTSITVMDKTGKTLTLGNLLILANTIGHSRKIGDTLR